MAQAHARRTALPFSLTATDGNHYSLALAKSRGPLLAAFFKVSCPTCQFTFPYLERLYQQFLAAGAAGVQVWGISQDNVNHTNHFAKDFGVTFPLLIDEEPFEVSQEYRLTHVPTLFLINTDGTVEISTDGFSKADLMSIWSSLAAKLGVKPAELFRPNEQVPAFKPG